MWCASVDVLATNTLALDLEFVGDARAPQTCRIYQIALVRAQGDPTVFMRYVHPIVPDDVLQAAVHGPITREHLHKQDAVPAHQALSEMMQFLASSCDATRPIHLLCHNAPVDSAVLWFEMRRHGVLGYSAPPITTMCTLSWARWARQGLATDGTLAPYSLEALATRYLADTYADDNGYGPPHNALADALTLVAVVRTMMSQEHKPLSGIVLPLGHVALRIVPGIGAGTEIRLVRYGLSCVQALVQRAIEQAKHHSLTPEGVEQVLKQHAPDVRWQKDVGRAVLEIATAHDL